MVRTKPKVYFKHGMWWVLKGIWIQTNLQAKTWIEQMNMRREMTRRNELMDNAFISGKCLPRPKTVDVMYQGVKRTLKTSPWVLRQYQDSAVEHLNKRPLC